MGFGIYDGIGTMTNNTRIINVTSGRIAHTRIVFRAECGCAEMAYRMVSDTATWIENVNVGCDAHSGTTYGAADAIDAARSAAYDAMRDELTRAIADMECASDAWVGAIVRGRDAARAENNAHAAYMDALRVVGCVDSWMGIDSAMYRARIESAWNAARESAFHAWDMYRN